MKNYSFLFVTIDVLFYKKPLTIWYRFGQDLQPYGIILIWNVIFLRSDFKTAEVAERRQFSQVEFVMLLLSKKVINEKL